LLHLGVVVVFVVIWLLPCSKPFSEGGTARLATAYLHGRWEPPALEFLTSLLGRRTMWPPVWLARDYFGREWFVRDFEHDATDRINYYLTLRITAADPAHRKAPYLYHVAFRHRQLFGQRWLQYGYVQRERDSVSLRHINGFVDRCEVEPDGPTIVQTWAGPGPAVFRIASLHPFALDLIEDGSASAAMVRFPG
ncbi:MAG: hypothetical protein KDI37_08845, partial [Xanthomonadales bacterium]|nr:hypothetical protein [Xanthomonadales bacterium]